MVGSILGGPRSILGSPREVVGNSQELIGSPKRLLVKSYKKLQKVTKVTKCISDIDFEHPAFRGVSGGTRASPELVQEWASDLIEEDQGRGTSAKNQRVTKSYEELHSAHACMSEAFP